MKQQDKRHLVGLLGCSSMSTVYNRDTWLRLSAAGLVERRECDAFAMFGAKGLSVSLTPAGDTKARELLRTGPPVGRWRCGVPAAGHYGSTGIASCRSASGRRSARRGRRRGTHRLIPCLSG